MLNYIWAAMVLIGISYGAVNGKAPAITEGALAGAKDAINLCLTMAGVMALWTGLMEIAERSGLMEKAASALKPLIHFLFPGIPEGHPAQKNISANIIANLLGLGWAATPAGLKAMEDLAELEEERRKGEEAGVFAETEKGQRAGEAVYRGRETAQGRMEPKAKQKRCFHAAMPPGAASDEMCMFLIVNISSLQLIPVNMIAYRSQFGSVNAAAVIVPAIAATTLTTIAGILFAKIMEGRRAYFNGFKPLNCSGQRGGKKCLF